MEDFNYHLPIEYEKTDFCKYEFPTKTEKIINLPCNINIKAITKVYSSIDLIFNYECTFINNLYCTICNVTLNIEYIDSSNDNTISIFSNLIYAPMQYYNYDNISLNNISPKISDIHLKLLDNNNIYVYLALSPY
ncbi:MAG: hypothetical protein ACRDA5_08080 [Clostridium sp.]